MQDVRHALTANLLRERNGLQSQTVQEYLAHTKTPRPRTSHKAYAQGFMGVPGGWAVGYGRGTPVNDMCQRKHLRPLSPGPTIARFRTATTNDLSL